MSHKDIDACLDYEDKYWTQHFLPLALLSGSIQATGLHLRRKRKRPSNNTVDLSPNNLCTRYTIKGMVLREFHNRLIIDKLWGDDEI